VLYLDGDLTGWNIGDEVIVSSTESGGQPEYFIVGGILNGSILQLGSSSTSRTGLGVLATPKIGTTVEVEDQASNLDRTVLDGRATVSLLSRNVEIRGGYDSTYDYISGVGPDLSNYGGTIRLWDAWQEDKDGWCVLFHVFISDVWLRRLRVAFFCPTLLLLLFSTYLCHVSSVDIGMTQ